MAALDMSKAVDRVRLAIADYVDPQILDDATIQYVLTKNADNEATSIKECAIYILGALSMRTQERLDRIEFFGNQAFSNYKVYLTSITSGPLSISAGGGIYAAGIDKTDVFENCADSTVVHHPLPLHKTFDWYSYNCGDEYASRF